MTTHSIIRDLKYIKDNHEFLDFSENEIEKITEALQYIKVHAIYKIVQNGVKNDPKLIEQIETEISRYSKEIREMQEKLQNAQQERINLKKGTEFKYPEFVPPKRQEGIDEWLQNAVEQKHREIYEYEKAEAKKKFDLEHKEEYESIQNLENSILKYQKSVANLSVLKEKYESKDYKKFINTMKFTYNVSDKQYQNIINLCAEGMMYKDDGIETERTPGKQEELFIKKDNGEGYIPNAEAIRNFTSFLDEHPQEIEEVNKIFEANDKINEKYMKISNLKKQIEEKEGIIESVQEEGKEYEEYLRDVSDKITEIKELRFKVDNSRLPAKQMGFFARIFARIFKNKKVDKLNIEKMEADLNEKIDLLRQKIKENEYKFSLVREAYHDDLQENMKDIEMSKDFEENGLRINREDWDVINSSPWLEQKKYDKIYEKLVRENANSSQEIKMLDRLIKEEEKSRADAIDKLSPEAERIYLNSDYSNYWTNTIKPKERERLPAKYLIGGLYKRYIKITGNKNKHENKDNEKISPYIALKILNSVLEAQNINTLEDAANLGVVISKNNVENCKENIKYVEKAMLEKLSEEISEKIKLAKEDQER